MTPEMLAADGTGIVRVSSVVRAFYSVEVEADGGLYERRWVDLHVEWDVHLGAVPAAVIGELTPATPGAAAQEYERARAERDGWGRVLCVPDVEGWDVWVEPVTSLSQPPTDYWCNHAPTLGGVWMVRRDTRELWRLDFQQPRHACRLAELGAGCRPALGLHGAWPWLAVRLGPVDPGRIPVGNTSCPLQPSCLCWAEGRGSCQSARDVDFPPGFLERACAARSWDEVPPLSASPCSGADYRCTDNARRP